jgi:hypothetical protein
MKRLAWNCRGLSCAFATRSLRVKISKYSPDIMFLFETKTDPTVACIIMNRLGFLFYFLWHMFLLLVLKGSFVDMAS